VEHLRPVLIREDGGAPGVNQERRVPGRQEAAAPGCWRRQRRAGHVEQLLAGFRAKPAQPEPPGRRRDLGRVEPRPARDVAGGRGAEPTQITTDEVVEGGVRPHLPWAEPVLGRGVEVGAALRPGPRRRGANKLDPQADAGGTGVPNTSATSRSRWAAAASSAASASLRVRSHPWRRPARTVIASGQ
jgi:hypothetical protein